jgi:hypothetical protein
MSQLWWKQSKESVHEYLIPLVEKLQTYQSYRTQDNLRNARLYGNLEIMGLSANLYSRAPVSLASFNRPKYNIVQSCVDTASAKIAKNKPRPTFLTDGGDWGLQQKAKKLEMVTNGQFYASNTYQETSKAFIDGAVLGTGIVKVYSEHGEVKNERVLTEEILVDDAEALYGKPRNLYQVKPVAREVLIAQFPEHAAEIELLKCINSEQSWFIPNHADMVEVVEAWHLRSSPKAKDGAHAIVIRGATLHRGEWNRDKFPFAAFRYNNRQVGFYGQGIPEIIVGIQVQINKMLLDMSISDHLNSAPAWLVEENSEVISAHINNEIGHIVKYKGIPPELRTWATYHPQKAAQLEALFQKAYQLTGISELSSQGTKPAGLDSGKALREFNDIESERFVQVGQRWEQFHMDIAELNVMESKEIYSNDSSFAVTSRSKKFIKTIKWADVDMADDKYQMQIFPTSSLPQTPAGRMAYVQEMMTSGLIDPDTGLELLEFPDLDTNNNLRFAARNVARETVSMILEDGKYRSPEPFDDLQFLMSYAQMSYNYARIHGAPEDRLELLRRLIEQCNNMLQSSAPAPQAAPVDPMGAPPPLPTAPLMQAS